ncbi:hypothetical protein N7471_002327 [Penicillium samsonianum]|uniref:uncharacterized protein n=1 Tax=Penicillium samsonianum TaxID=1882272 RepID=UPI00254798A2|nr:uncharacterized protein N7471_002327 [Penicillium samsonianum]KAJ6142874.1 hypothetical protein N7471_002327 [Penicillium samsonianum]
MVGRCSKGRKRRKTATNTDITDVTSRDSNSGSTVLNGERSSSQEVSYRPLPASAYSTGSNRVQLDLDLTAILNWNTYSAPDPAEFADHIMSPTDEFGHAISQLDIPISTDGYASWLENGLEMAFVPSSTIDCVSTALPPTPDEIVVGPGIACTSESLQQQQTASLPGNVDIKPEICTLFLIMSNLEAELGNSGSSIDKIMHTVKASTKEIEQVIQSKQWHFLVIGPMLALVAIEVALILIESIVSRWGSVCKNPSFDLSTGDSQNPSALTLGQYRAESEEAVLIWRHIVLAELQRLRNLIEVLGGYLEGSSGGQNGRRPVDRLRNSCIYQEQKATFLVATLQGEDLTR